MRIDIEYKSVKHIRILKVIICQNMAFTDNNVLRRPIKSYYSGIYSILYIVERSKDIRITP